VAGECYHIILSQHQGLLELQDRGGISDVLGGRSPVAILSQIIRAGGHQLLYHGQNRIADQLRLALEFRHVDAVEGALGSNFIGTCCVWDEARRGLYTCRRGLNVEVALHPMLV
jgi:hypothetical protein